MRESIVTGLEVYNQIEETASKVVALTSAVDKLRGDNSRAKHNEVKHWVSGLAKQESAEWLTKANKDPRIEVSTVLGALKNEVAKLDMLLSRNYDLRGTR